MHCHIHLIPRREGDVENPQGGVRGVISSKQHYKRKKQINFHILTILNDQIPRLIYFANYTKYNIQKGEKQ